MPRLIALLYGFICYILMYLVTLYLVGFITNIGVPKSIDSGGEGPVALALFVDIVLILLFGFSHSIMARSGFKTLWTRFVPKVVERSTYLLFSTLFLTILFYFWIPLDQSVWTVQDSVFRGIIWSIFILGIIILFSSTFMIDHFDLFGLRQTVQFYLNKSLSSQSLKIRYFYKFIRHPIYLGWLIVIWATPDMSMGHIIFATGLSIYILIAIRYEERDLVNDLGSDYIAYQTKVPKLFPRVRKVFKKR